MANTHPNTALATARLDQWFQTMRGSGGYSGPISHWWESSLLYCGAMADWRYEGLICGYVALYRSTGQHVWLTRAQQAGNDLVTAQLPSGMYRNSAFQQGPMEGGTPHEAAADVGLLELALLLRHENNSAWHTYFNTAQRNIQQYLLAQLWNGQGFLDQPWNATLVPNKNATTIEALVLYEILSEQDMSTYLHKAAQVILAAQECCGARAGATIHLGTGHHRLAICIYTARSMCGLLRLYERDFRDEWLDRVALAVSFLRRSITSSGPYFGFAANGSVMVNPRFIAGAGDILRLMLWSRKYGIATDADVEALVSLLVNMQHPSGGIPTATGLAYQGAQHSKIGVPDFRDVLPVVGWCDKAFRALALLASCEDDITSVPLDETEIACTWKNHRCVYRETATQIQLTTARSGDILYSWKKGSCYPSMFRL